MCLCRLLNFPMPPKHTDANTATDSSTAANGDVNEGANSSVAQTSTASTDTEQSLADVVMATAAKHAGASTEEEDASSASGSKIEPDEKEEAEQETDKEESASVGTKKEGESEGGDMPPFHTHPRWQEKVAEVNQYKSEVERLKPLAEAQESIAAYLTENGVTPQEFQNAVEIAALLKTNPEAAANKLRPMLESLGYSAEGGLPKDLVEKVENGTIQLDDAKEIARLRVQAKAAETRGMTAQQVQVQAASAAKAQAIQSWESATAATNPDFRPKTDPNGPDGLYEMTVLKFSQLMQTQPPRTPQQITALAQRAYEGVMKTFGALKPKPKPTAKVLSTTSSSGTTAVAEPKSVQDVVMQVAAKHGL